LGITQKTAWFMDHRIRRAMKTGSFMKMSGEVEADETFIGGLARNMHKDERARKIKGTGGSSKEAVLGIVERGTEARTSRIKTVHVPNVRRKTLAPEVRATVEPGATVHTDALKSYLGLSDAYTHETVDHANRVRSRQRAHEQCRKLLELSETHTQGHLRQRRSRTPGTLPR
jgi:transposase-like protein